MTAAVDVLRRAAGPAEYDPWAGSELAEPPAEDGGRNRPTRPQAPEYVFTTRKPTGACAWPLIMLDGPEFGHKSTTAVELANDPRIGRAHVMPIGEEIDWLGQVADFDIIEHNGEWWQIIEATRQYARYAAEWVAAGEKPPLLIVDSASKIWELLSTWAEYRARSSDEMQRRLANDPNAEIPIGPAYWNPANRRHRQLVTLWRNMPAIVIVTARGKMVTSFDEKGKPINGKREYSVQAQSELGFSTQAWVRLGGKHPEIIGCRMAKGGVKPGEAPIIIDPADKRFAAARAQGWEGFNLAWLLFDVLRFDPAKAHTSYAVEPVADASPDDPGPVARPAIAGATEPAGAGPATGDIEPATVRQS